MIEYVLYIIFYSVDYNKIFSLNDESNVLRNSKFVRSFSKKIIKHLYISPLPTVRFNMYHMQCIECLNSEVAIKASVAQRKSTIHRKKSGSRSILVRIIVIYQFKICALIRFIKHLYTSPLPTVRFNMYHKLYFKVLY